MNIVILILVAVIFFGCPQGTKEGETAPDLIVRISSKTTEMEIKDQRREETRIRD